MRPLLPDTVTRRFPNLFAALGLSMLLALPAPLAAETAPEIVQGEARVIDADILIVAARRIILWGLDAPERAQTCNLNGKEWGCYDVAKRTLEALAGRGPIECVLTGEPDAFGRRYGVCTYNGEDLNAQMVLKGAALAFSEQTPDYEPLQLQAITDGVGLWQAGAVFEEPWAWRRSHTPGGYR
jgi:endonuclease YncB( thermonuclease family)